MPGPLLRTLLAPARDPGATPTARIGAYRELLYILEGTLGNQEFARALHSEWMKLSLRTRKRRSRR